MTPELCRKADFNPLERNEFRSTGSLLYSRSDDFDNRLGIIPDRGERRAGLPVLYTELDCFFVTSV